MPEPTPAPTSAPGPTSAPPPAQPWRINPESTPPAYICDYCGHWGVDRLLFAMHMQQRHDVTIPEDDETVAQAPRTPDTDPADPDQEPLPLPEPVEEPEPEPEKEPVQ